MKERLFFAIGLIASLALLLGLVSGEGWSTAALVAPALTANGCSAHGYVYYDGVPVSEASVHIESLYGSLDTTTNGGGGGYPQYSADLSAAPLLVSPGDVITVTATYGGNSASMAYEVAPGEQQVDVAIVINPVPLFGDGSDGDLVVSGTYYVDDLRTALAGSAYVNQELVPVNSTAGFEIGQEVLIIQMQGTGVGNYEFRTIQGLGVYPVVGLALSVVPSLAHSYTVGGNSKAQVLRVPNYQNVTVQNGGTLTAHAWNGDTGGIIAVRVKGTMTVKGGGEVSVSGKGFRGAIGYLNAAGRQGESQFGNWNTQSTSANGMGGGGAAWGYGGSGSGGGGGGHATVGSAGDWAGETPGSGGETAGIEDLTNMFFGGAGGSGSGADPEVGGSGGNSGGALLLFAQTLSVAGSIRANGNSGTDTNQDVNDAGAGGSGAGGSVLIKAVDVDVGSNLLSAVGGPKVLENQGPGEDGGAGGSGRIRIEYSDTLSGTTDPPASTQQREFHTGPIVTIHTIYPHPAIQGQDVVTFRGSAVDNDEGGASITQYVWRSDLGGLLSTQTSFTRTAASLSAGTHTIYFKAKDDEGEWSAEITTTLTITFPAPTPTSTPTATPTPTPTPQWAYVCLPLVLRDHISYFEGPWEAEPNNTYLQANGPLRSSQNYYGYPNDQKDYFSIYLRTGGQISIDLTNHTGQGVQLQLFYQAATPENRVAYDLDAPYHVAYSGPAGWYYVYIYTESGHNSTTPYTLRVTYPGQGVSVPPGEAALTPTLGPAPTPALP